MLAHSSHGLSPAVVAQPRHYRRDQGHARTMDGCRHPVQGIEAAFRDPHPILACRIDPEARHAGGISPHMRLADQHGLDTQRAKMIANGHLAGLQRHEIPACAMRMNIPASIGAHAAGAADRRLHIRLIEAHAPRGEGVYVGRVKVRMAVAGQIVPAQLVAHDEKDVSDRHSDPTGITPCSDRPRYAALNEAPAQQRLPIADRSDSSRRGHPHCRTGW